VEKRNENEEVERGVKQRKINDKGGVISFLFLPYGCNYVMEL
jgi:hypothetical protein